MSFYDLLPVLQDVCVEYLTDTQRLLMVDKGVLPPQHRPTRTWLSKLAYEAVEDHSECWEHIHEEVCSRSQVIDKHCVIRRAAQLDRPDIVRVLLGRTGLGVYKDMVALELAAAHSNMRVFNQIAHHIVKNTTIDNMYPRILQVSYVAHRHGNYRLYYDASSIAVVSLQGKLAGLACRQPGVHGVSAEETEKEYHRTLASLSESSNPGITIMALRTASISSGRSELCTAIPNLPPQIIADCVFQVCCTPPQDFAPTTYHDSIKYINLLLYHRGVVNENVFSAACQNSDFRMGRSVSCSSSPEIHPGAIAQFARIYKPRSCEEATFIAVSALRAHRYDLAVEALSTHPAAAMTVAVLCSLERGYIGALRFDEVDWEAARKLAVELKDDIAIDAVDGARQRS